LQETLSTDLVTSPGQRKEQAQPHFVFILPKEQCDQLTFTPADLENGSIYFGQLKSKSMKQIKG